MNEFSKEKSNSPKVILVSGQARNGKDTAASMMRDIFQEKGESVLVTHYADLLKYMCRAYFGWNGEKDDAGRSILQYVGTDVVREKRPDFWIDFIGDVLDLFPDEWDYVIIPDTRFPNEITGLSDRGFNTVHVHVERPGFDNGLTQEQKSHPSETALEGIEPDYTIVNDGDLKRLYEKVSAFTEVLSQSRSRTSDNLEL